MMVRKTDEFPPDPDAAALARLDEAMARGREEHRQTVRNIIRWRQSRWFGRSPKRPGLFPEEKRQA